MYRLTLIALLTLLYQKPSTSVPSVFAAQAAGALIHCTSPTRVLRAALCNKVASSIASFHLYKGHHPRYYPAVSSSRSGPVFNQVTTMSAMNPVNGSESRQPQSYKRNFELTNDETLLFSSLKSFKAYQTDKSVVRVAGGWVRDKILGKPCYDVDLAIHNKTGSDFAEAFNEWLQQRGEGVSVVKIRKNPDKSKHLETAKFNFHGLEIDVVNLRSESYVSESRRPNTKMGTPYEDAERRDFTVNSLFYNIETDLIEDWLRTGVDDLNNKILRACGDPTKTLSDDPLRAFRAVRFSSSLNFTLDEQLSKAMYGELVGSNIKNLLTIQRSSGEVSRMLEGDHAHKAMRIMFEKHLLDYAFPFSDDIKRIDWKKLGLSYMETMHRFFSVPYNPDPSYFTVRNSEKEPDRRLQLFLASFLWEIGWSRYNSGSAIDMGVELNRAIPALKKPVCEETDKMMKYSIEMMRFADECSKADGQANEQLRIKVGKFLYSAGDLWRPSFSVALVVASATKSIGPSDRVPTHETMEGFLQWIYNNKLKNIHLLKPFFDGIQIQEMFPKAEGVMIGKLLAEQTDLQIRFPNDSASSIRAKLISQYGSYT